MPSGDEREPLDPWQMSVDDFIGPSMVGEAFSIDGREPDGVGELVWESLPDPGLPELWKSPCGRFRILDLGWEDNSSVALEADGEGAGFYSRGQSWVDPEWRGRGLAVEMVLQAARLCGGSPCSDGEVMGFSEAGHNLHLKAHAVSVDRARRAGEDVAAGSTSEP